MVRKRAAFVTIGQSPRDDIIDEMRPWWASSGASLEIEQFGALDGLDEDDVATLAPGPRAERLVSRLRSGREVVLDAGRVHERVGALVAELDERDFDFLVLLCTGKFPELRARGSRLFRIEAQAVVDHALASFSETARTVGVLVPHEAQKNDFACETVRGGRFLLSHASPYSGDRWNEAASELAPADLIVLHCMGYSEPTRRRIAERTGRPVLLARRMVATAVAQVI